MVFLFYDIFAAMAIEQIEVENFLQLARDYPVLDVRSPGEFKQAHIPNAFSLPLFTDEERKIIGTAYKQEGRKIAVKKGLKIFSTRMQIIPGEAEEIVLKNFPGGNTVLVHCWRGGMRSRSVAWLLDLYGFKVFTLKGGYKSFRNWAFDQFERQYNIGIVGGYTGSGKTLLLHQMALNGDKVIDLEALANHKGSAFGSLGENPQPGQEMFENLLAVELNKKSGDPFFQSENIDSPEDRIAQIWMEDESRHIGTVGIPKALWEQMRSSPLYFLEIPFEKRLEYIISTYGSFDKKKLADSVMKIQKRLGGLETKNAINFLMEGKIEDCFTILLRYYDKLYKNALDKRDNLEILLTKIPVEIIDPKIFAALLDRNKNKLSKNLIS